jgi:hypothetical protein
MSIYDEYINNNNFSALVQYVNNMHIDVSGKPQKEVTKILKIQSSLKDRLFNTLLTYKQYNIFLEYYFSSPTHIRSQENIKTQLISCYYSMNNIDEIWKIIHDFISQDSLKRRHLLQLIDHYCKNDINIAFTIFDRYHDVLLTEDFQMFFNNCKDDAKIQTILERITGRRLVFDDLHIGTEHVISDNICTNCGSILNYKNFDSKKFITQIKNTDPKRVADFNAFEKFASGKNYDIVIDTANIFYFVLHTVNPQVNEKSFAFLQLLLENLKGFGFVKPLLVIHNRHKKTLQHHRIFRHIFVENITYWTPNGLNDDYFSLIACWLKYPVPILTYDLFRDHKFLMDDQSIFEWYDDTNIRYNESGDIFVNSKFSKIVQNNFVSYHIPLVNGIICWKYN